MTLCLVFRNLYQAEIRADVLYRHVYQPACPAKELSDWTRGTHSSESRPTWLANPQTSCRRSRASRSAIIISWVEYGCARYMMFLQPHQIQELRKRYSPRDWIRGLLDNPVQSVYRSLVVNDDIDLLFLSCLHLDSLLTRTELVNDVPILVTIPP